MDSSAFVQHRALFVGRQADIRSLVLFVSCLRDHVKHDVDHDGEEISRFIRSQGFFLVSI